MSSSLPLSFDCPGLPLGRSKRLPEAEARADEFSTSVCAVLLRAACNMGLRAVEYRDYPALVRGRLNWVQHNYIRAATLTCANARLMDYQGMLSLAQAWGGGDVASADGLRFVTLVHTLNAGPNLKYFGSDRGMIYSNRARFSLRQHRHVNMLGRFAFALAEPAARWLAG